MKTACLIALLLASAFAMGCSTTSSSCGCVSANCCSWDWYKPCDLIEGRVNSECAPICGQPRCQPGMVVSRCYAVEAQPAVEVAPDAMPPAPAPADTAAPSGETGGPVADYGLPPGR